jgi:glycosyltransferase involved in cell wall biosynthesis
MDEKGGSVAQSLTKAEGLRVLYIETYTETRSTSTRPSSDAIGYGITCSEVMRRQLRARGIEVVTLRPGLPKSQESSRAHRLKWILKNYTKVVDILESRPPDIIFFFHAFTVFPGEIRRILLDLGHKIPLVGYTHGSHWDPTDSFRTERYPRLELLDLANLSSLDRILVVSKYMRDTLVSNTTRLNSEVGGSIADKIRVVGLPLNVEMIDTHRTEESFPRPTVVFNHAPVSAKHPELFARTMICLMPHYPVDVLLTRRFHDGDPGEKDVRQLIDLFGDRVILGNDMSLPDYYRSLWKSQIQVSTATHESLGVATLEAMYTKNCCILPRIGSYPEICNGNDEVLYEPKEGQLAQRIAYFLENPQHRDHMGTSLSRLAERYAPAEVVDKIIHVFLEVINGT